MASQQEGGLPALEARLKEELQWLELPARSWVPPRQTEDGQPVLDVAILGAGMCGLAAAAALRLAGVDNVRCFDRAPAGREGPWKTYARMETLRSPKQLTGPALGLASLTFRAWYQAQFGADAWAELDKIPRTQWMDYLVWYRRALDLPVQNDTEITRILPGTDGLLALETRHLTTGEVRRRYARRVVVASGRDGLGGPYVPAIADTLDRRYWAHTSDDIDFDALRGKRVAVIGAGASAMDNAAEALERGAGEAHLFFRRQDIPRINKFTGIASQGVVQGFLGLSDDWKWKFLHTTLAAQTPPPRDSTLRVSRHANAFFHAGSPVEALTTTDGAVRLTTPKGDWSVDFVIFATGFQVDLPQRSELAHFIPAIKQWRDVFTPAAGLENAELAAAPYLGPAFEFQAKTPEQSPLLARIHCFNYPSTLTHGKLSGDIPAVSDGARRLTQGIIRSLFVEDREQHYADLLAFETPELLGDEWRDADEVRHG
ncbi:NAD(P)-binding domain-containing protein [Dickeya fangzhongdai]|uniref:NAD(P)-binding domain-containing protein n=1 Tax=Dickeya fangzhongdai TaxID=1778540 RepID=UPI0023E38314|nr:NAD(P)/FAD-dependent oxidoreductase [Dickeya fangzhongdai]WES88418.1 NAD(P)/FAD-dependent oxidoreductase [Dickeya fangzhongdai]